MAATRCSDASHSGGDAVSGKLRNRRVLDGDEIDGEDQLLLRQPHDETVVRVVAAHVQQLERGAAQIERAFVVYNLVGHDDIGRGKLLQLGFGVLVGDERGAQVLEQFAAGYMIIVAVAVD